MGNSSEMNLSFDYDRQYSPAFPVLEMRVTGSDPKLGREIIGLIDSGSDATQLPLDILRSVGARRIDRRWVRDLSGVRYGVAVYAVQLQIGAVVMTAFEVIGREGIDEVIVGRDVLNQFIVTLNGLAHVTEVSD